MASVAIKCSLSKRCGPPFSGCLRIWGPKHALEGGHPDLEESLPHGFLLLQVREKRTCVHLGTAGVSLRARVEQFLQASGGSRSLNVVSQNQQPTPLAVGSSYPSRSWNVALG